MALLGVSYSWNSAVIKCPGAALLGRSNTHPAGPNQAARKPEEIRAVGTVGSTDGFQSTASPTQHREGSITVPLNKD